MDIKILVVEDNEHIGNSVKTYLSEAGYLVDICMDGDTALEMFYDNQYHLVVLDIMLPGMDGQGLLKEFRKLNNTPVLMMTALSDEENQIKAFSNEADDYVTKPFNIQVMMKRVEALLRRSGVLSKEISYGGLVLYPEALQAEFEGKPIILTRKEFEILMLLVENRGKVISPTRILSKVWGYDFDCDESTVWTHMKNLRSKLPVQIIKTVRGAGYRVEALV